MPLSILNIHSRRMMVKTPPFPSKIIHPNIKKTAKTNLLRCLLLTILHSKLLLLRLPQPHHSRRLFQSQLSPKNLWLSIMLSTSLSLALITASWTARACGIHNETLRSGTMVLPMKMTLGSLGFLRSKSIGMASAGRATFGKTTTRAIFSEKEHIHELLFCRHTFAEDAATKRAAKKNIWST